MSILTQFDVRLLHLKTRCAPYSAAQGNLNLPMTAGYKYTALVVECGRALEYPLADANRVEPTSIFFTRRLATR